MDEHHDSALHYGHVGRAVYLPEEQAWTFTRSFAQAPSILYTGVTDTSVPSPFPPAKPKSTQRVPEKNLRHLIGNAYPELAATWSSIRQEPLSRAITTTIERFDPESSSLFDIGYATDKRRYDKKLPPVPIAAAVSGECRNVISFRTLEDANLELRSPTHAAMRAPSIGDTETSEWSKCGAPIRQVHFARLIDEDPIFMAARLLRSTTIFRPLYHFDPVPMHFPDETHLRPSNGQKNSRLDANPILEISVAQTGGYSHSDVTFNPWYQQQFGIVDTRGHWSVWEIDQAKNSRQGHTTAGLVKAGILPPPLKRSRPPLDGWASIEWIHEVGLIIVANRRDAMIYAFIDGQTPPRTVVLNMQKQSEWVLDLKRNPRNLSQFFVLTTSRILWFDIGNFGEQDSSSYLHPRVSWRHFRDPNDTTLRLSELVVYKDLYLVLFSRLTELVQAFPCPFTSDEDTNSMSVADPFVLDGPSMVNMPSSGPEPVRFSTFVFREVGYSPSHLKHLYNPNLTIIKLFWMDSNLAIHESVFRGPRGDPEDPDLYCENNVVRLRKRYAPTKRVKRADDFIVDDWDESAMQQATVPRCKSKIGPRPAGPDLQWSLDLSHIYSVTIGRAEIPPKRSNTKKRPAPGPKSFDDMLDELQRIKPRKKASSKTIFELSDKSISTEQLDQSARDIKRIFSTIMPEAHDLDAAHRYLLLPLQSQNTGYGMPTHLSGEADHHMLEAYDQMVDDWVSTLRPQIPVQVRLAKEKLVRKVAADLLLSRVVQTKPMNFVEDPITTQNEQAVSQNQTLPSSFAPSIPASQSQVTNRTRSGRVKPPSKYSTVPVLSGLSAFTTFKKQRPMPANVSNLLSHWSAGDDPSSYIWEKIEDQETRVSQTPRTPKRKKRMKPEQPLPATPLVPMVRTWGSQPVPQITINSSQPVPMTQAERGAFGAKKKKKKRAAGF
ncbi:unnamed protein product [Penicillium salamii]|uniref:RNA polymerase I-specific transcription initiation factor RRN6-like protein n=1 Tax=Penicillium salamii TaxID=1612424 RepID=A0A9W4ISA7_9EURO|nr:unnamed protein product [Penicillium salamii]CAG8334126.1 unnamed protein product [Penicillium salamii]CAG8358922.1 unnamed protein product [Penicillium salamii]CAG8369509.1 unnamed protein product [Penicillium salamii]